MHLWKRVLWAFSPRGKRADNTQPDGLGYGIMPLWGMRMVNHRGMNTSFAPKGEHCSSRPTELDQQTFALKGQYPIAQPTGLGSRTPQNASPEGGQFHLLNPRYPSIIYLLFAYIISFGMGTYSLSAQSTDSSQILATNESIQKQSNGISAFYMIYLAPDYTEEELKLIAQGKSVDLDIFYTMEDGSKKYLTKPRNQISPLHFHPRREALEFYIEDQINKEPIPVGNVLMNPHSQFHIILLIADSNTNKINARAYPVSYEKSLPGTYTFINATNSMIAVTVDKEKGVIEPQANNVLKINSNPMSFFRSEFYSIEDEKPKRFDRVNHRFFDNQRYISIIVPNIRPNARYPKIYNISDDVEKLISHIGTLEQDNPTRSSPTPTPTRPEASLVLFTLPELWMGRQVPQGFRVGSAAANANVLTLRMGLPVDGVAGQSFAVDQRLELLAPGAGGGAQSLASVDWSGKLRQAWVFLAPNEASSTQPYRLGVFPQPTDADKKNHLRIYNICNSRMALALDKDLHYVEPGQMLEIPYPENKTAAELRIALQGNGWERVHQGNINFEAGKVLHVFAALKPSSPNLAQSFVLKTLIR